MLISTQPQLIYRKPDCSVFDTAVTVSVRLGTITIVGGKSGGGLKQHPKGEHPGWIGWASTSTNLILLGTSYLIPVEVAQNLENFAGKGSR